MKKIKAKFILTPDKIIENGEILFKRKIIKIGKNLPNTNKTYKFDLVMPALINTHTHLEFSKNKTLLEYGDFITWLNSVIHHRENLFIECKGDCFKKAIDEMKRSGVCAFGEISSTGNDLKYLRHSPLKVVYFNEIVGSNPGAVDVLYTDFLSRLQSSLELKSDKFHPAISIHSPYSVHPILMQKVLNIAREKNLPIQAHFMESKAEREWLDRGEGDFKKFFEKIFPHAKPLISPKEFLYQFRGLKTTFIHCVWANDEELDIIKNLNASIAHCPISNRLLNVGKLNLKKVMDKKIPFSVATDGLSSNYSLNIFKELRAALFMHYEIDPNALAKELIISVTKTAANSLNLNNGEIAPNKDVDLIAIKLPHTKSNIHLHTILHTNEVEKMFINGEEI